MRDYTLQDLEKWNSRIEEKAVLFGLDFYSQEFEIADQYEMMEFFSREGVIPRYTHWSFGKRYDHLSTLYTYGIQQYLPYEQVMFGNPCHARLISSNSLTLNILVMAHVYGHNNFFKNNAFFAHVRPDGLGEKSRAHARRIRELTGEFGRERVGGILEAAHGLRYHRFPVVGAKGHGDGVNILRFLIEHAPKLDEWEREILEIVDREFDFFHPLLETKIIDEGWAAYWHYRIVKSLGLPQGMQVEFLKHHTDIVHHMPEEGGHNPYLIGFNLFEDIKRRWDRMARGDIREGETWDGLTGDEKIFQVMRTSNDASFIRPYLTRELAERFGLASLKYTGNREWTVEEVSDEKGWEKARDAFIRTLGLRGIPFLQAIDANWKGQREFYWRHIHDGRTLDIDYAKGVLKYLHSLWRVAPVHLETIAEKDVVIAPGYPQKLHVPYLYSFDGTHNWEQEVKRPPSSGEPFNFDELKGYLGPG